MSILSGGVPTGYRHTGERALTAIDIRWLHSAANDGRPISRMSCYAFEQMNSTLSSESCKKKGLFSLASILKLGQILPNIIIFGYSAAKYGQYF